MEQKQFEITVGKYKFRIIDNILRFDGQIYTRNFKIGGIYTDCVNISVSYKDNKPICVSIPILTYNEDCSLDAPLDRGNGTIIMIRTILQYVRDEFPEFEYVRFDDMSSINCANMNETKTRPVPLYYFSIAFNGITWYEKYFKAKLRVNHDKYRETVSKMMNSTNPPFIDFLQIAKPPPEIIDELKQYYSDSGTYREFFTSIPKNHRCRCVRDWISTFMNFYLENVFSNKDWIIPLRDGMIGGKTRKKRKNKYYCPNAPISINTLILYDVGAVM
jgi:hypothetical protein